MIKRILYCRDTHIMIDLISYLRKRKIHRAFSALNLSFDALFPEKDRDRLTDLYGNYEWIVNDVPRFGTIINGVPPDESMPELPWEEWYVLDGVAHHHVLYLKRPPHYDEIFKAPEHDDVHPPRTLGKSWYVVDDPDMNPVLLRNNKSGQV